MFVLFDFHFESAQGRCNYESAIIDNSLIHQTKELRGFICPLHNYFRCDTTLAFANICCSHNFKFTTSVALQLKVRKN